MSDYFEGFVIGVLVAAFVSIMFAGGALEDEVERVSIVSINEAIDACDGDYTNLLIDGYPHNGYHERTEIKCGNGMYIVLPVREILSPVTSVIK